MPRQKRDSLKVRDSATIMVHNQAGVQMQAGRAHRLVCIVICPLAQLPIGVHPPKPRPAVIGDGAAHFRTCITTQNNTLGNVSTRHAARHAAIMISNTHVHLVRNLLPQ